MTSLLSLSLCDIRDKLAREETRPGELVESCLERIAATEPSLRACLTVCADEARARAAELENNRPSGKLPPLWGVPLTLKDILCTQGVRTTAASRMLENFVPPYDAFAVRRVKEAGAVILAKTNLDEFAMGSSTEFSAFFATANPWDIERIPGGSSGGSAASVSAGQAFGSLGTDTGGSIRQPAGLCGCVGIKPTYGRVSRYGAIAYASSLDQIGPLARTVDDCSLLLRVIAGYDPKDAQSADLPVPDYRQAAAGAADSPAPLAGVTLGLPVEYWREGLSPEVESACENAVDAARELGASVKELSLPHLPYGVAAYYILASAEASTNLARFDGMRYGLRSGKGDKLEKTYSASRSQGFGEEVKRRVLLGTYALSSGYYDAYYTKASKVRRLILEDFERALGQCDALLAPSCPITAWPFDAYTQDPLTAYKMDILTLSLNLAGLPGISLPVGLGKESRLPVGMQIMGRAFDEEGIIRIAKAVESALPPLGPPAALAGILRRRA
ncbi:MAG: Asp-tRNA(Asn)/Glu-tRNA(Gln) amidotransferase subunit GatA [Desulfovibrio sp.]|jgi:aspartyl-tRNA(Asn)/glutamyl-tRNA(Gln) amidotransferase subunit A|nr:Asp-tRNA(Asn)/Glu-tRNA(Gln) amidotransferase subunit GatA [Desulfovibrio sp.]